MRNILKNKKVAVLGFAKSGIAAANLAISLGAEVLVSDISKIVKGGNPLKKGMKTEFGLHSDAILKADLIIKSPGIHRDIEIIKKADKKHIPVLGEIEFAANLMTPKRLIAITGTNGKTTTTTLVGRIFRNAGLKTIVAGNIGNPLSENADKIDRKTNVILEVSSYQLEDSTKFSPDISAILNITPDHLEHHRSMANYIKAKKKIFINQTKNDYCVINYDDPVCRRLAIDCPAKVVFFSTVKTLKNGVYYRDGQIFVRAGRNKYNFLANLKIPGMHNVENVLAAVAIASVSGINPKTVKKSVLSFHGVEHRIEFVKSIGGVKYFNDSKGTNVDSTRVALESFGGKIWLILGGRDKGAPYKPLIGLIRRKVKGIMLIGEASDKIRKGLAGTAKFYDCGILRKAVEKASETAEKGDIVLLSPACASFDQFADFEERGRQFKLLVGNLRKK